MENTIDVSITYDTYQMFFDAFKGNVVDMTSTEIGILEDLLTDNGDLEDTHSFLLDRLESRFVDCFIEPDETLEDYTFLQTVLQLQSCEDGVHQIIQSYL